MFSEEYAAAGGAAKAKSDLLKRNPFGYFVAALLSGLFIGLGILFVFCVGGLLTGQPYARIVMGGCFGIALSLVIMAGAELFTGNNFVMSAGVFGKTVTLAETIKLWLVCYIGNWIGSIVMALLFVGSGAATGQIGEFIAASAATKMSIPFAQLLFKGVLCNTLVCIAVWCSFRCKSESAKLIMVFWCLFAFLTSGYEHSIANMAVLTVALLSPFEAAVSVSGYFYNILVSSAGNMLGGIFLVALPYSIVSRKAA